MKIKTTFSNGTLIKLKRSTTSFRSHKLEELCLVVTEREGGKKACAEEAMRIGV